MKNCIALGEISVSGFTHGTFYQSICITGENDYLVPVHYTYVSINGLHGNHQQWQLWKYTRIY